MARCLGRRDWRELALIFTGGDFGEGSEEVLNALGEARVGEVSFSPAIT